MKKDIVLIVGNGLTMSFKAAHDMEGFNDLRNPLTWNILSPNKTYPLIDDLPCLKQFMQEVQHINDFDLFEKASALNNKEAADFWTNYKNKMTELECRHYLCLAFANFSIEAKALLKEEWAWFLWLKKHQRRISSIASFNYDLIVEEVLERIGLSFYDETSKNKLGDLSLYKPHGSCNYESSEIAVSKPQYPLKLVMDRNDTPLRKLMSLAVLLPRIEPVCVIPNQKNIYSHYQSMAPQNSAFNESLKNCRYLLIIGHSYAPADRPEIDGALNLLRRNTIVIIANPEPSTDLIEKAMSLGLNVILWKELSGPFDNDGNLLMLKNK